MAEPEVTVTATAYTVSVLPFDHVDADVFSIKVEMRSEGRWAVCHLGKCLDAKGVWSYETNPSSRTKVWKKTHRFDLDTALKLARTAAPEMRINGFIAREIAAESAGVR